LRFLVSGDTFVTQVIFSLIRLFAFSLSRFLAFSLSRFFTDSLTADR